MPNSLRCKIKHLRHNGTLTERECDRILKALEQQPCEDCISRESTVKRLCKVGDFMNKKRSGLGSPYIMAALFIQDNKDEFPSVTPQQKIGHWILLDECSNSGYYCSECHKKVIKEGWSNTVKKVKYCPNCGARMAESEGKE